MASQMRRIMTSNLLGRSAIGFRTAAAACEAGAYQRKWWANYTADRRPNVDLRSLNGVVDIRRRSYSYSATPGHVFESVRGSISGYVDTNEKYYFKLNIPGMEKTESDESVCVFLNMPGVNNVEHVKFYVDTKYTGLVVIKGEPHDEAIYVGCMDCPDDVDKTSSDIKGEMIKHGMFKLTLPKLQAKTKVQKPTLLSSFITRAMLTVESMLTTCIFASVVMPFARSNVVVKKFCSRTFDSFSIYKKEAAQSQLNISIWSGLHQIGFTREDICTVSLKMPELKIEDVKSYFKHGAFFIEGRRKTKANNVHYLTAIRLPEGYSNVINTQMQDGIYKTILAF